MCVGMAEEIAPLDHPLLLPPPPDPPPPVHQPTGDGDLSASLRRLYTFLTFFCFNQSSPLSFSLSWFAFFSIGVSVQALLLRFPNSSEYEIKRFEIKILASQSLVAAVSLLCVSHNLRKYGIRKFLFVDKYHGHVTLHRAAYVEKIRDFFRLLATSVLTFLVVKAAREIARIILDRNYYTWWESVVMLIALLTSWTYATIIFLSGPALFSLVCNLQVIHFENYGKLLESDLDVSIYIEEHIRLTHYLSKISHRFRVFLLLELLVVTVSQFVALFDTTGNRGILNIVSGGDFVVSSFLELVGTIICLSAAAKITHRAQGLASVASRWHALVTCSSGETQLGITSSSTNLEGRDNSIPLTFSESDLEAGDYVPVPTSTQLASYTSLYHKRQAFVMYMGANPGGFTLFGWTVDRALINTIFFIEMSLVLFVLGKTITVTTQ